MPELAQRADYTFKHNAGLGRHGWLRLTPAYSVKIVGEIIGNADPARKVLDPFSGTATTALHAAQGGMRACAVEINPFLQWFGRAKLRFYPPADAARAVRLGDRVLDLVVRGDVSPAPPPPIRNIHRWWDDDALAFLRALFAAVEGAAPDPRDPARDLLLVAFCRVMIGVSKAAFNHQSVSFRESAPVRLFAAPEAESAANEFRRDLRRVADEAVRDNPAAPAKLVGGDSRRLDKLLNEKFDLLITSPPYANRMSYIRELRPHMYWLGHLREPGEAGDLDWRAIGGTWGSATSRLAEWRPAPPVPARLGKIAAAVSAAAADPDNGALMANYILKYFEDARTHLASAFAVLNPGAEARYIVGNSIFYGVNLPTEEIYADLMERAGFRQVEIRVIRKRNSKKGLREYDVTARRP